MTLNEAMEAFKMDSGSLVVHVFQHDPPGRTRMEWKDVPSAVRDARFTELYWGGGDTLFVSFSDERKNDERF